RAQLAAADLVDLVLRPPGEEAVCDRRAAAVQATAVHPDREAFEVDHVLPVRVRTIARMPDLEHYDLGTPFLRMERDGHLAWCTIDRPASRNALSAAMYFGLKRAVQIVNARALPTALIVTGVGDVFAPGGELRGKVEDPNPVVEQLGTDELLPFEAVRN